MTRWETHAGWWQDGFTDGADAEYEEQILPLAERAPGRGPTGAGRRDGRGPVGPPSRRPRRRGGRGRPDAVPGPRGGRTRGGPTYARSGAERLPFVDGAFDAVVACLVFEHLLDPEPPIREVARVLEPGGRFLFFLNHPLLQAPDSGWVDDQIMEPPEQYWRVGAYLVEDVRDEEVAPGIVLPFVHRPLSRYVNLMADAGLSLVRMEEPAPPPGFLARATEYQQAATIPRLLFLRAVRS